MGSVRVSSASSSIQCFISKVDVGMENILIRSADNTELGVITNALEERN